MGTSSKRRTAGPKKGAVAEIVAVAERIIADAKSGNLRGLTVTYVSGVEPFVRTDSRLWVDPQDRTAAELLAGEIYDLDHDWMNAGRGR